MAYALDPKHCAYPACGAVIPYEKRANRFCSRSCAATHNQLGGPGRHFKHPKHPCDTCGAETRNPRYCCRRCSERAAHIASDAAIQAANGIGFSPTTLRRYMLRHFSACALCGIDEWNGERVPLVMDHVDGDPTNDRLDNLRLVCANCDALLPTYKNKNRGNGREWRRRMYAEGRRY